MRFFFLLLAFSPLLLFAQDYPITPVSFTNVQITDNFWQPRMHTNTTETIPFAFQKSKETGRLANFAIAGGLQSGDFQSKYPYDDSDVYKIIEGAAYTLALEPNPELDSFLDTLIGWIAAAQEEDGYLMTWRSIQPDEPPTSWSGDERWDNMEFGHELYNVGHLYEAAVAHYEATGKRTLLEVALKNADLLVELFASGQEQGYPGHQEVEIGLVKLYRITDEQQYLDLSRLFLERRGKRSYDVEGNMYEIGVYWQDHNPVLEQTEAVGHAVRAGYMYAAMADIAALTGDERYLKAIDQIWENVVRKKLYITGGVGGSHYGEAFAENYELPNEEAYAETCAAIANDLWNYRMFLLHGDAKYIDVLERTLYNGLISGVSLEGNRFFYPNPLAASSEVYERSEWFSTSCCPSNISRFLPSLPGYVYARQDEAVYVNLFISNEAQLEVQGTAVNISQTTAYPWDGKVEIELHPTEAKRFSLHVRLPGWSNNRPVPGDLYQYLDESPQQPTLSVNGKKTDFQTEKGYAVLTQNWQKGDKITLELPMQVRRVVSNEAVTANAGRVALQYGPVVYCAEWLDNGGQVSNLLLPDDTNLQVAFEPQLLGGVNVIRGQVKAFRISDSGIDIESTQQAFQAIPYALWAHRGKGEMQVWLNRTIKKTGINGGRK